MGYVALLLLPNCILTALILLWAGQSAFRFSTGLYGAMKGSGKMTARPYCLEFSFLAAGLFAAVFAVIGWAVYSLPYDKMRDCSQKRYEIFRIYGMIK